MVGAISLSLLSGDYNETGVSFADIVMMKHFCGAKQDFAVRRADPRRSFSLLRANWELYRAQTTCWMKAQSWKMGTPKPCRPQGQRSNTLSGDLAGQTGAGTSHRSHKLICDITKREAASAHTVQHKQLPPFCFERKDCAMTRYFSQNTP